MLNEQGQRRNFEQMMNIFVIPEMKRRQESGKIPKLFNLWATQIIFLKKLKPIIRLNTECKILFTAKVEDGCFKEKGLEIRMNHIESVDDIKVTGGDGNKKHFSMVRIRDIWYYTFNFGYNKQRAKDIFKSAKEFYFSAKNDYRSKRWRPFISNICTTSELLAKSQLIQLPHIEDFKTHGYLQSEYNKWYKLGNVESEYRELLNEVFELRDKARYSESEFKISESKAKNFLSHATSMLNYIDNILNN